MNAEKKDAIKGLVKDNIVVLFLLLIIVALSILSPYFLKLGNLMDIAKQASINGIIALGMTYVITTGGIDLSVGPVWALSGVVSALLMTSGVPWPLACLGGVAVGACCGLFTGLLVTKGKMQPFIATLATMNVYRGVALIITGGYTVYNLPAAFREIGGGMLFGIIPMQVIVLAVIFVVSWFIFTKQITGRHITAIGSNREAARLSGISVEKTICWTYVYSGIMCAIGGGIVATARLSAAEPTIGSGAELDAIAAVVIGGTSMSGGESRIFGTLVGAVLISAMNNGLTLLSVPTYYKIVVVGLILIVAMLLDSFGKTKQK